MVLTPKQIQKIKEIINRNFNVFLLYILGAQALPDKDRRELEDLGYFDYMVQQKNMFHDAYFIGKDRNSPDLDYKTYKKWKEEILRQFVDPTDQNILENITNSTNHYVNNLRQKFENLITTAIINANKEAVMDNMGSPYVYDYSDQKEVDIKELADELREATKDMSRDWERVVTTELTSAHTQGSIQNILEDNKGKDTKDILVYAIGPLDSATCRFCKKFYHDEGSFKVYRLSELLANGTNIGKKQMNWRPVAPPAHPNCRHRLVELPQGFTLNKEGQVEFVSPEYHDKNSIKKALKTPTFSGYRLHKRMKFQGMDISIENRKGSVREWKDRNGNTGKTKMRHDYGYIRRTVGNDGDHIDCYVGPNKESDKVFVIHQKVDGKYDEDKVMLGFNTRTQAKRAFLIHYDSDSFYGSMTVFDIDTFKDKVLGNKVRKIVKAKKGEQVVGHQYIKRTGSPGNYKYWYRDEKGRIYSSDNPPDARGSSIKGKTKKIIIVNQEGEEYTQGSSEEGTQASVKEISDEQAEKIPKKDEYTYKRKEELRSVSSDVLDKFKKGDYEDIKAGGYGDKGKVTHDGKDYFVKTVNTKKTINELGKKGALEVNRNEIAYTDIIYNNFSDLSDHFAAKVELDDYTFMQDFLIMRAPDLDKDRPYFEENSDKISKMGIINYLLGNDDRHFNNFGMDDNTGEIKLFDEGMALHSSAFDMYPRTPAYVEMLLGSDIKINKEEINKYFTEEKLQGISQRMNEDYPESAINNFEDKWYDFKDFLEDYGDDITIPEFMDLLYFNITPEKTVDNAIEFIDKFRDLRFSDNTIEDKLLKRGFNSQDIDDAFKSMK